MLKKLYNFVTRFVFTRSFLLGLLFGIGLFSKYIFGYNNLAEELSEFFIFKTMGQSVNFSPEVPEEPNDSLGAVIKNWELHKK